MKWKRDNFGFHVGLAGRRWVVFVGPFRCRLWCYETANSLHWTSQSAKQQALMDAIELLHERVKALEATQ